MTIVWLCLGCRRLCLFSLVCLLFSIPALCRTFSFGAFGANKVNDSDTRQLRVLTYNTHQCQQCRKAKENDVLQYVRDSGADIVFLQEYEVRKDGRYLTFYEAKQFLQDIYPYSYFDFSIHNSRRQYGLAVFSRYPLLNKKTIRYESRANISDCCDVLIGSDTVRLINNHLESNRFTADDFERLNTNSFNDSSNSLFSLLNKMRRAYSFRSEEARVVGKEISASPYPVIVAGDMNDVPVSYTYRQISNSIRGLQDCFLQNGSFSCGNTFKIGKKPWNRVLGFRIDYIFVSSLFKVIDFRIDELDYSDHFPSIVTLRIEK